MPLYYLVWAIWPPLAAVAENLGETSERAVQHDGGAITTLTNRLTGETYTLPEPLTELAPGVRLFEGPGKEKTTVQPGPYHVRSALNELEYLDEMRGGLDRKSQTENRKTSG